MAESSISSNGFVHGHGNHYIYSGNYMEDNQMGEHFWNFLTKEEPKAHYNNEKSDVEAGINTYFQNDFKSMIVYEQAGIKIEDCIDNDLNRINIGNMVTDVDTDDDEVIDARFHIEEFQDMTADYSHVDVPDVSYSEVLHGKPTYYSHAREDNNAASLMNHDDDYEVTFVVATKNGMLETMKKIVKHDREILTNVRGFDDGGTALHHTLRYGQGRVHIAKWLVDSMKEKELETKDTKGYTSLALAVLLHHDRGMLECMIDKNPNLPKIGDPDRIPIVVASSKGFTDTTKFLYPKTRIETLPVKVGVTVLNQCLSLNLFGIAREILKSSPEFLEFTDDQGIYPIHALAKAIAALQISNTQHKKSGGWNHVLSNLMNCCCYILLGDDGKQSSVDQESICEAYELLQLIIRVKKFELNINGSVFIRDAMMEAAEYGLIEFITEILEVNQELITINKGGKNMFWYAIMNRQEKVFNLIYAFYAKKDVLLSFDLKEERKEEKEVGETSKDSDCKGKQMKIEKIPNILHFAAKCPSSSILDRISGPALQMQRELQWFKAVEDVTIHRYRRDLNESNQTPYALFMDQHKELLKQGEEDMKKTAMAATTVGALIVTTMFAAAFSVATAVYPIQSTSGSSSHDVKVFFIIFLISAALSLFSCTSSIIVFLGILASRYSPEDFLRRLPGRLMIGFWSLFMAIASMMVAFCVGLHTMLKSQKLNPFIIGISAFSLVPIAGFIVYLCPLLCEICGSTCKTVFDKSTRLPKKKKKPRCEWC